MLNRQLPYWLALNHAPKLSPNAIDKLLNRFGSPENLIKDNIKSLSKLGLSEETLLALKNPNWKMIENECQWAEQEHQTILTLDDANYPSLLKETASKPTVLYIKGDPTLINSQQIAIVGSRNPSPVGREIAESFAASLSAAGLSITSGLALGIDAAGHRGALYAKGKTIAVLGSGVESIYPCRHKKLSEEIIQSGCLVSEFSLYAPPKAAHFPRRNRIISGLSLGTLVVEAKLRSGSLITARFANEQCREVFAIPGSIQNSFSRGCHQLINNGALLVETANDILEELNLSHKLSPTTQHKQTTLHFEGLERQHIKLLECVDFEITSIDQMIIRSKLPASTVTRILLILKLHGYISSAPGGYRRVK